jgi:predicted ABC-type ATPase
MGADRPGGDGSRRPVLHVVAGPNGAGKSTLFRLVLEAAHPGVEFVNADELARQRFGHPAQTLEESQVGQALAEDRRRALMAERKSLFTETTFSHPSKLELIADAKALGYEVRVYHVNVRSPEISVARVAQRVGEGGHPVPEDKIRERYERNQSLIRDAVRTADKAVVFDNSRVGQPAAPAMVFRGGRVVSASNIVPAWARTLYADDLARFTPERLNAPAASFKQAEQIARDQIGPNVRTYVARPGGRYIGELVGASALHVVQRLSEQSAVAHFADRLERAVIAERGSVVVQYPKDSGLATVKDAGAAVQRSAEFKAQRVDDVLRRMEAAAAHLARGEGGVLANALEQLRAGRRDDVKALLEAQPVVLRRYDARLQELGIVAQHITDRGGQER